MPRSYPGEFRRKVLDLVEAGRPVAEIAEQLAANPTGRQSIRTTALNSRPGRSLSAPWTPCGCPKPCRGWSGGSSVFVDEVLRAPATHRASRASNARNR